MNGDGNSATQWHSTLINLLLSLTVGQSNQEVYRQSDI